MCFHHSDERCINKKFYLITNRRGVVAVPIIKAAKDTLEASNGEASIDDGNTLISKCSFAFTAKIYVFSNTSLV